MLPFAGIVGRPKDRDNEYVVAVSPAIFAMHPPVNRGEILVVEDPMIQKLIHEILARYGYSVTGASALQAADLVRKGHGGIIVITNAPAQFLSLAEVTPLLYIAASPDRQLAGRFPRCRVVSKPFDPRDLLAAVRELAGAAIP